MDPTRSTKRANKEMEERLRVFEKKVEAQRFVMTNLRNGIDYLKDQGLNSTQFDDVSKRCHEMMLKVRFYLDTLMSGILFHKCFLNN